MRSRSSKRSLSINPADSDAHYLLGTALIKGGQAQGRRARVPHRGAFVPTDWCEPYEAMAAAYTALKDEAGQKYAQAMVEFCQGDADRATKALQPWPRSRRPWTRWSALG